MRHKRWLILLTSTLVLVLGVYFNRDRLKQIVVAAHIYHAHVFTPPPTSPGESWWHRLRADARFYWDISELRMAREKRLKQLNPDLEPLVKEINRRQAAGEGMQYSMHIYREIRWLLNFTPDIESTQARIDDLRRSLGQTTEQKLATEQQASDGSWGLGFNIWYLKLYYSVEEGLPSLLGNSDPEYPLSFLDQINSPEKLTARLDSVLHDDFTKTDVFNRMEFDNTFSALARLLFGHKRTGYAFHPQLRDALRKFVEHWQNPESGCWGQWMVDRDGRIWKMDDVGMTFHVVSDLHGQVDHLGLITKRLLQLEGNDFPAGIRYDGHYENHMNWDIVKIFRYAWPTLDAETREKVRAEISSMLEWCLAKSYQPDGSFKVSDLDETLGDAFSYGVSFLREAGYFQREDRFWTDQEFPNANVVRDRIEAKLKSIGLNDPGIKDAYETLHTLE
jgi:hypothetical protein